jgi:regulator of vacuolar morphogenesis
MAPSVEISIPTTSVQRAEPAYTLYHISVRLPLRTYVVPRRFSEFVELDGALRTQAGAAAPATLPGKSWMRSTVRSAALTESRRRALEAYVRAVNEATEGRWRGTSAWRAFVRLPSSAARADSSRAAAHADLTAVRGELLADERDWLDAHREMKGQLHDARLHLARRDEAATAKAASEAGAGAKRCLVRAAALSQALDVALDGAGGAGVGQGEQRRRRDLVASARCEHEGLERLAARAAAAATATTTAATATATAARGRVLGARPETSETRALDNAGVQQLQREKLRSQEEEVEELARVVRRQAALGTAIGRELAEQNEMLGRVEEDADRVAGKIAAAAKRVG